MHIKGICLERDGVPALTVEWFHRLFAATWALIPAQHRDLIECYWISGQAPEDCRGKLHVKERYQPKVKLDDDTKPEKTTPSQRTGAHRRYFATDT
jgi:hypothetical protein